MHKNTFKKNFITIFFTSTLMASLLTSFIPLVSQAKANAVPSPLQPIKGVTPLNITINKSPADERIYQAIKLDNQMTVLLVSDPKATRSMGVLALPIGSLDDPSSQQGLAHYLEHMILMGSKNYPEPSGFSEHLKKFGGMHNASTGGFRTNYYFEIDDSGFEEALDRLADAIAAPLFDKTNSDKERNAVNSELTLARSRDGMRLAVVGAETINPEHPASQFFGGNLETLSDKPNSQLHQALETFYRSHYSSNYMVGVIYSPRTINEMQQLAINAFGRIPNHNKIVPEINIPVVRKDDIGIMIHYVPVQPQKSLNLEFIIPDTKIDTTDLSFLQKNETYIAYLIRNSSPGTLATQLKEQGYINDISAGAYLPRFRNAGSFNITVDLTDKGYENRDKVIAAIFQYIELIKQKGIQQSYFEEISRVLNIDFEFPSLTRDLDYVSDLAENMLLYPMEHIIDVDNAIKDFNPMAIEQRLSQLTWDNARIWIISPNETTNKTAYFVEAPYQVVPISQSQKTNWSELKKAWDFSLPQLNPYLADDFTLYFDGSEKITVPKTIKAQEIAVMANNNELKEASITLYHMPSLSFYDRPQANVTVKFRQDQKDIPQDPEALMKQQILSVLTDYLAGLNLDELAFQSQVAGISFSTYDNAGLTINADGYTQHLLALLNELITQYATFKPTEAALTQAKSWYKEKLAQADNVKPFELALQPLQVLSQVPYFEREMRKNAVDSITLQDLITFRDALFSQKGLEILSVGNLTQSQLAIFISDLNKNHPTLIQKDHSQFQAHQPTKLRVNSKGHVQLTREGKASDSALGAFFIPTISEQNLQDAKQLKKFLFDQEAKARLLNEILQPWFYDELRSKEQLGYALFTLAFPIGEQYGIGFLLQSNVKQPAELKSYFDAFYPLAKSKLETLDEATFEQYKAGLLSQLNEPEQTVNEEASRFLTDFHQMNNAFDRRSNLISSLNQIDKKSLVGFFNSLVQEQSQFSVLSEVSGTQQAESNFSNGKDWTLFNNVTELQNWIKQNKQSQ